VGPDQGSGRATRGSPGPTPRAPHRRTRFVEGRRQSRPTRYGMNRPPGLWDDSVTVTVEAYVFVSTTNPAPRTACKANRRLPGVVRADAMFGGPAAVAIVRGRDLAEMDAPIDAIAHLPTVNDTETHVVRPIEEEDGARARTRGWSGPSLIVTASRGPPLGALDVRSIAQRRSPSRPLAVRGR
jgi:hypothetical protein